MLTRLSLKGLTHLFSRPRFFFQSNRTHPWFSALAPLFDLRTLPRHIYRQCVPSHSGSFVSPAMMTTSSTHKLQLLVDKMKQLDALEATIWQVRQCQQECKNQALLQQKLKLQYHNLQDRRALPTMGLREAQFVFHTVAVCPETNQVSIVIAPVFQVWSPWMLSNSRPAISHFLQTFLLSLHVAERQGKLAKLPTVMVQKILSFIGWEDFPGVVNFAKSVGPRKSNQNWGIDVEDSKSESSEDDSDSDRRDPNLIDRRNQKDSLVATQRAVVFVPTRCDNGYCELTVSCVAGLTRRMLLQALTVYWTTSSGHLRKDWNGDGPAFMSRGELALNKQGRRLNFMAASEDSSCCFFFLKCS